MVEGERGFVGEKEAMGWAASCVGAGEVLEGVHRALRECQARWRTMERDTALEAIVLDMGVSGAEKAGRW